MSEPSEKDWLDARKVFMDGERGSGIAKAILGGGCHNGIVGCRSHVTCLRIQRTASALAAAREEGRAAERAAWEESHGYYLCVSKKQAQADINESHSEALAWQAKAKAAQGFAQTMQHERDFARGVEAPAEYDRGREEGGAAGFERGRRQGMEEAAAAMCAGCKAGDPLLREDKSFHVCADGTPDLVPGEAYECEAFAIRALLPPPAPMEPAHESKCWRCGGGGRAPDCHMSDCDIESHAVPCETCGGGREVNQIAPGLPAVPCPTCRPTQEEP